MEYNFKGLYDQYASYVKKDVVSYTSGNVTKIYFCLTDNIGQQPNPNADTEFWAVMNTLSNFPNSIDTFIERRNIQANDKPYLARYQELQLKMNLTPSEQDELNSLSARLRDKLLNPEDFNALQDAIENLQMFFKNEVEGVVNQKYAEFEAKIDGFVDRGNYSSSTTYNKWNTVTYNFETYMCLVDGTVNILPTNTSRWKLMAARGEKGEKGDKGANLRFVGEWNSLTQYIKDDAVRFDGRLFAAKTDTIGNQPSLSTSNAYWELAVDKGQPITITTLQKSTTITDVRTTVTIAVSEYNSNTDALMVVQNGIFIGEGINYKVVNGNTIENLEGSWDGTQYPITFNFIVIKNMVSDQMDYADGSLIQDGSIAKVKLMQSLQDEITNKANQTDLNTTNNNLTTTNTNVSNLTSTVTTHTSNTSIHKTSEAIRKESGTALIVETRTSDPTSPEIGRIWFRSDL